MGEVFQFDVRPKFRLVVQHNIDLYVGGKVKNHKKKFWKRDNKNFWKKVISKKWKNSEKGRYDIITEKRPHENRRHRHNKTFLNKRNKKI